MSILLNSVRPLALILWNYQQGEILDIDERKRLNSWLDESAEHRNFFHNILLQKEWLERTLFEFLEEFDKPIEQIRQRVAGIK